MKEIIINALRILAFLLAVSAVAYGCNPARRGPEGF